MNALNASNQANKSDLVGSQDCYYFTTVHCYDVTFIAWSFWAGPPLTIMKAKLKNDRNSAGGSNLEELIYISTKTLLFGPQEPPL